MCGAWIQKNSCRELVVRCERWTVTVRAAGFGRFLAENIAVRCKTTNFCRTAPFLEKYELRKQYLKIRHPFSNVLFYERRHIESPCCHFCTNNLVFYVTFCCHRWKKERKWSEAAKKHVPLCHFWHIDCETTYEGENGRFLVLFEARMFRTVVFD